ncbi:LOW QUALITY PROTEIN: hypothetical protein U9M48_032579 [Paspalum notatum var. saurae]|uniref:DUF4218 domain-containing protein n=1 Tax=Paspalum notatum var. saurae TaxID=547442 RepID=A0AAQ3U6B7_PASNO
MLVPYNLPPWICMKQTSLLLSMTIPGPNSPGNDVDVYLQPLIDELLELLGGVTTFDASSQEYFPLRATLLWTINDFPALAYLYGWSTGGKYACPSCGGATKSFYLKKGKKMCYMGHRRWLPHNHIYRRLKRQFDGNAETELAPVTMSCTFVLRMLVGRVFVLGKKRCIAKKNKRKGKNKKSQDASNRDEINQNGKRRRGKKKPEDWLKKKSIFFMLPYWEHNRLRHNLDVMHIEKNVCENFIATLLDIFSKTKDDLNAFGGTWNSTRSSSSDDEGKKTLPAAPFTMSREKKEILCSVIQKIRTPDGYASNISRCVNMNDCALTGLKSHDNHMIFFLWHSDPPSKDVMKIVIGIANFFKKLCSKQIDVLELDKLQESIVMTLCDMERNFLPSFFTVSVHLMVHLVEEVKLGGPIQYRWMYPMERFFVRLKALVKNRAHPEGSIAEGYCMEECMTFCSRFVEGNTRFTRPARNPEPLDKIKEMFLFDSAGEPIGKATAVTQFDNQLLAQAHRYVLRHCDELDDSRKEFVDMEKTKFPPSADLTPSSIEKLINDRFPD